MNNLEWLYEHERDKLVKLLTGEYISCDMCYYRHDYPDCGGECERNVREWLDDVHSEQIPDRGEHVDAPSKPISQSDGLETAESGETATTKRDMHDFGDSRERLKSDAYRLMCDTWNKGLVFAKRPYEDIPLDAVMWKFGDMLNLLDRQAAITERETEKKWSCFSDSADGHIAELTNQLESAHAKNRALKAHIAKMQEGRHGWHIKGKELQQQVETMRDVIREFRDERDHYIELFHEQERRANELQSRDANIAREIGTLRAERDRYRELCGKLLDAADEMRRVRDQFDAFTEVD